MTRGGCKAFVWVGFCVGSFLFTGEACKAQKGSPDDVGGPQYAALENASVTTAEESNARRANHRIKTAFVIVMENHSWHQIIGNRKSAPYINDVLLPAGALADNYHNNDVEPSEPNYVWMEAGNPLGIRDNDGPDQNYRNTKKHLVSLLVAGGVQWKTYQQSISGTRCPLVREGAYEPKHNPMIFFADVTENNNPRSENCIKHMRPESEITADLTNDAAPLSGYIFITPDACHNMHDKCEGGDEIRNGDNYLASVVPKMQASQAYKNGGAIFITWDEGDEDEDGKDPALGMIVLSPFARVGYRTSRNFNHSTMLRTLQEIFAVEPFLRGAATAPSFAELFTAYP
jgi:phosphatidylinositol-3-phosphatase